MDKEGNLAARIAKKLEEKGAVDVRAIRIYPKASFADYMIVSSGRNKRQISGLVEYIENMLEPEGVFPKIVEGREQSGWILMDYGNVVVNIMTEETRDRYRLEKIWGDCETVDIDQMEEDNE